MSENDKGVTGRRAFRLPWWVSVLLAIACYCTLKYLVPQLQPASPLLARLVHAAPFFAPIVAIPLLLLAAKQLYDPGREEDGDRHDSRQE